MHEDDVVMLSSFGDDDMIVGSRALSGVYSREWITRIYDIAVISLATVWLVVACIGIIDQKSRSHGFILMIGVLDHHDDIGIGLMDRREESVRISVGVEDIGVEE